jgi:hypothetical protein
MTQTIPLFKYTVGVIRDAVLYNMLHAEQKTMVYKRLF